jgi:type II secretory pathway pseudopilin PulG
MLTGAQTPPLSAPLYPPTQPGPKRLGLPAWVLILILIPCIGALLFGGAVCTAIAVPTFVGQRVKAQDAAAKSLVRNAMTSVESQFVDSRSFDTSTALPAAHEIDPRINFQPLAYDSATGTPRVEAQTKEATVAYDGQGAMYMVVTVSETGRIWGVSADKGAGGGTEFFCVETDGSYRTGW